MKLLSFRSVDLNGYLNFNLDLDRKLSFLVGINGSGKTTVLRTVMALLGPDIGWLNNTNFKLVSLKVDHEGRSIEIKAERGEGSFKLTFSRSGEIDDFCHVNRDLLKNSNASMRIMCTTKTAG